MQERTDPVSQTGNGVDHTLIMLEIPLISPWMKSLPHWNACPGSPVITG